jgi:hypothetical protein
MQGLDFLAQSRTLMYQALSGSTMALVLEDAGKIKRRFEILSEVVTVENEQVHGPYTNWVELGLTREGGVDYFRVVCASQGEDPKGPVLLCIEFNEGPMVRVGKIARLGRENSIYGTTAFSVPVAESDDSEMNLSGNKTFSERSLLCAVESNGRLSLYSDGTSRASDRQLASFSGRVTQSTFPLLVFETLASLTGSELV